MVVQYKTGGLRPFLNLFQREGSVISYGLSIAFPVAIMSAAMKFSVRQGAFAEGGALGFVAWDEDSMLLLNNAPWNGLVTLVSFLTVFRTSQAYSRFEEAVSHCYSMRSQWLDAANGVCAFCEHSMVDRKAKTMFKRRIIRLFSLLHGLALQDLANWNSSAAEEGASVDVDIPVIDLPGSFEEKDLKLLKDSEADERVGLVQSWIQVLIVKGMKEDILSTPPPIITRLYQQIGDGMVEFTAALRLAHIPFPFPYSQVCQLMLILHWFCTPVIIQNYCSTEMWAFSFSFIMVLTLWCLDAIATDLEAPLGNGSNKVNLSQMQRAFDEELLVLLEPTAHLPPRESDAGQEAATLDDFLQELAKVQATQEQGLVDLDGTETADVQVAM